MNPSIVPSWATTRDERPTWRGWLHAIALVVAVPAVCVLVVIARPGTPRLSAIVYSVCLLLGFASSAAYHRLHVSPAAQQVLQRIDHSTIFLVIAGSYTPMCLVALSRGWGVPLLVVVWGGAAVGIGLKVFGFERFKNLGYAMYPIVGWAAAIAALPLYHALSGLQFSLVLAAGLLYTIGIPVLMFGWPDPWPRVFGYHEVWHAFTVAAAICQFLAIASLVR